MQIMKLYGTSLSGHVYRITLLLKMLNLPYEFIDAPEAVRQSEAFRQLNPFRQIPLLVDGELVLPDSNAIMTYLVKCYAPGSHWLPEQPLEAAQVQMWLSRAAGELRYGPAACRLIVQFSVAGSYQMALDITKRFLPQVEQHLSHREFLATERPTIADLACYSYLAVAPEGGISLVEYPAIRRWIARIQVLPGFFAMPALPEPTSR